jgi:hypothetical protein
VKKQTLADIQSVRGTIFESHDGTLFTGGGWCGYKPPYYSVDGGETWQIACQGSVYPPNSTFSYVEFKGLSYCGTGYSPFPGQVYRWMGNGHWQLAFDLGLVRNIVKALAVHDGRMFVGSWAYASGAAACGGSAPVHVSDNGYDFTPVPGIPGCFNVEAFVESWGRFLALVWDVRTPSIGFIYEWDAVTAAFVQRAPYPLGPVNNNRFVMHAGALYAPGQIPGQPYGMYFSENCGLSWHLAFAFPIRITATTCHENAIWFGTETDSDGVVGLYRFERAMHPGTGGDFLLRTGVNGPPTACLDVKWARAFDALILNFVSPGGTLDFQPLYAAMQVFPTGALDLGTSGLPGIQLNFGAAPPPVLIVGPGSLPFGAAILGPKPGSSFAFLVPSGFGGSSVVIQGLVLTSSTVQGYLTTDAHEIRL